MFQMPFERAVSVFMYTEGLSTTLIGIAAIALMSVALVVYLWNQPR